jgi:hypothetical protein
VLQAPVAPHVSSSWWTLRDGRRSTGRVARPDG